MDKQELAKKLTEEIQQMDNLKELEEMLKKNYIQWDLDGITYRVRKPNYQEHQKLRREKIKKHNELRNDPNWKYEEQLIQEYEEKGKNIAKMTEKQLEIGKNIEELELKLAELGNVSEKDTKAIIDLKIEIFNLMSEQRTISLEKIELLSYSIESELTVLVNSYICYLVLEKMESGENWIRVFDSYENFMNSDNDTLLNMAGHYLSLIVRNIE